MVKTNSNMRHLLETAAVSQEYIGAKFKNLSTILDPHFIEVYGCVIININNQVKPEKINFEAVLQWAQDRTGYEASSNEIRLNDYLDFPDALVALKTAEIIMQIWENKLLLEYPQHSFCMILSITEGYATLRFHQIRENERMWLRDDLEEYKYNAIMVKEFGPLSIHNR